MEHSNSTILYFSVPARVQEVLEDLEQQVQPPARKKEKIERVLKMEEPGRALEEGRSYNILQELYFIHINTRLVKLSLEQYIVIRSMVVYYGP